MVGGYHIAARIYFVKSITPKSLNMPHSSPLEHALRTGVSGTKWGCRQSCRIQELFLHQNRVTQESCGSAMMQYTKKHMVDYCSACSVVHIVVQCMIQSNICKRNAWVQKGETCITITSAKQTNDILKVMTNK